MAFWRTTSCIRNSPLQSEVKIIAYLSHSTHVLCVILENKLNVQPTVQLRRQSEKLFLINFINCQKFLPELY